MCFGIHGQTKCKMWLAKVIRKLTSVNNNDILMGSFYYGDVIALGLNSCNDGTNQITSYF